MVAEGIINRGAAVAVFRIAGFFNTDGAGHDCPSICLVSVIQVDVQKRRECAALANGADHDNRVTDADFRWPTWLQRNRGAEDYLEELDNFGWIGHNDARRHEVVDGM
jgi:hypothetical protein